MVNIKENAKMLCRDRCKGVSLVISMCVCVVLLGLALSVIFSASMLLRSAERKAARERCYQLANSFAAVLQQELAEPSFQEGSFSVYITDCLALWQQEGTASFHTAAHGAEEYGTITVTVTPFAEESIRPSGGSFLYHDSEGTIARLRTENLFIRFRFFVQTSAALEEESYACTDAYCLAERFQPLFSWAGMPLYWAEGWYMDSTCTVPFVPESAEGEAVIIDYTYDADTVIASVFLPAVGKGGAV